MPLVQRTDGVRFDVDTDLRVEAEAAGDAALAVLQLPQLMRIVLQDRHRLVLVVHQREAGSLLGEAQRALSSDVAAAVGLGGGPQAGGGDLGAASHKSAAAVDNESGAQHEEGQGADRRVHEEAAHLGAPSKCPAYHQILPSTSSDGNSP